MQNFSQENNPSVFPRINLRFVLYSLLLLFLALRLYGTSYSAVSVYIWDEHYHIPSAQKYLDGVFFLEYHPPLGKLLIALGEYALSPNAGINLHAYDTTIRLDSVPEGMSFAGFRLVPVISACLAVYLFFLVLYCLSENLLLSLMGTCLLLFDNALVVHFRAAMLDGIQLVFVVSALLVLAGMFKKNKVSSWSSYAWLSWWVGCAFAVKFNAAVILLLIGGALIKEMQSMPTPTRLSWVAGRMATCATFFLLPFMLSWYVHFNIAKNVVGDHWYGMSPSARQVIEQHKQQNPLYLPLLIAEGFRYFVRAHESVGPYAPSDAADYGSYPFTWPFGGRAIHYIWGKVEEGKLAYLYLHLNPIVMCCSVVGLLLSFGIVLRPGRFRKMCGGDYDFLAVLLAVYISYMAMMMFAGRVMYLYHYILPYVFSLLCAFVSLRTLFSRYLQANNLLVLLVLLFLVVQVIGAFLYFSPLSYAQGLSPELVTDRNICPWWNIWPSV